MLAVRRWQSRFWLGAEDFAVAHTGLRDFEVDEESVKGEKQ